MQLQHAGVKRFEFDIASMTVDPEPVLYIESSQRESQSKERGKTMSKFYGSEIKQDHFYVKKAWFSPSNLILRLL